MPVTVVVGGQFGSEGKGKVALCLARDQGATVAIRVGGPNSGHTAYDADGKKHVFQQLPTAALLPNVTCVLGAGSYINLTILRREIDSINLPQKRLLIDPNAVIIGERERDDELNQGIRSSIGSTLSGTGSAVMARIRRDHDVILARNCAELLPFVKSAKTFLRNRLDAEERIVIEGTQGFGLSVIHATDYPFATSRDTSAAGFVSEAGLSPLDVDTIAMVLRAFPIRVSGNSGPLPHEIDWKTVTLESSSDEEIIEHTTVTRNVRRVGRFDAEVVRRAIQVNAPNLVILNHMDYIDHRNKNTSRLSQTSFEFIAGVEKSIERSINAIGLDPISIKYL